MVKHTQTIRRLLPTNCLSVFDHFVGLELLLYNSGNIISRLFRLFQSKRFLSWPIIFINKLLPPHSQEFVLISTDLVRAQSVLF